MSVQRKIRVAVVFGGKGPEHAVSCMGGGNMLGAIDRDRYEVIPVGITREGNWVLAADEPGRLAISGGELPSVEAVAGPGGQIVPWADQSAGALAASAPGQIPHLLGEVDVVLPILHGPFGEDGTIQGLLEMAGIRYVGAGVLASAVSMDKEYMKMIFAARGLPVGPHVVVRERDWPGASGRPALRPDGETLGPDGETLAERTAPGRRDPGPGRRGTPARAQAGAGRDRRARLAAIREAGQGRLEHRHVPGHGHGGAARGDRDGAELRPEGARRGRHRWGGDRVLGA